MSFRVTSLVLSRAHALWGQRSSDFHGIVVIIYPQGEENRSVQRVELEVEIQLIRGCKHVLGRDCDNSCGEFSALHDITV